MFRITFLGAGSTIFAKNILGDCILSPELGEFEIALHDIDSKRLEDSHRMLNNINVRHGGKATILSFLDRKEGSSRCEVCGQCRSDWWLQTLHRFGF